MGGTSRADVLLLSMPFGPLFYPSLGLSLLQPALAAAGVRTRTIYFTLSYAERIGRVLYDRIGEPDPAFVPDLLGEWIFAAELFPDRPRSDAPYLEEVLEQGHHAHRGKRPPTKRLRERAVGLRDGAGEFLDRCVTEVLAQQPRLVGFTSVFSQQAASLALARRLRAADPDLTIVFGGANCEGTMGVEVVRQFPFVDAVVSGEADRSFPALVDRVLSGKGYGDLPGVVTAASADPPKAGVVRDLDDLPEPDFADYFAQFRNTRFARDWHPRIPFESSRGCWWGERQHCTFCGLNGSTMAFRSKSAERSLAELSKLARRYPDSPIQVVDNILEMGYFRDFVPALGRRRRKLDLFYETKSNLKKDQVRALATAGIRTIQPGIESLSDDVLALMKKGVRGIQNVQLLKWCAEYGVTPLWNFLWGFPDEPESEYTRMACLVPLLSHLPPPSGMDSIRLDRFSPNYNDADALGLTDVAPYPSYRHVYAGLSDEAQRNLAYFFTYGYRDGRDVAAYTAPLARRLRAWMRDHQRSALFSVDRGDRLWIWDLRPVATTPLQVLHGSRRGVYGMCDQARTPGELSKELGLAESSVLGELSPLVASGLMLRDGKRYLSLAIPLGRYAPPAAVERFYALAAELGRTKDDGTVIVADPGLGRGSRQGRPIRPALRTTGPPMFSLRASQFRATAAGLHITPPRATDGVEAGPR